jgi:type IV pilus assembly protein PilY1
VPEADFAPYPNASTSGIDTYSELEAAVIDFAYGIDAFDQDGDNDYTDLREVVLGDIFHSTPIVIGQPASSLSFEDGYSDFADTYEERDRIVYVGANDGMLHAFHAGDFHADDPLTSGSNEGDDPATSAVEQGYYDQGTGAELFGYVPRLLLDKLKMLSRNTPRTTYYVDAPPVAADAWLPSSDTDLSKSGDEWTTVLITGFREGGAGYIALDITDPAADDESDDHGPYPVMMWEFTHAKLGEAWSEPIITRVKVAGASGSGDNCGDPNGDGDCREKWVAIFGGGYSHAGDPNHFSYEGDDSADGWTDVGKAIFMVDLQTGEILATVEYDPNGDADETGAMKYALPSRAAVLDINFDGFADAVYIGDLGGQMWKWNIHAVGTDSDADDVVDNWAAEVFFRSDATTLDGGDTHYRSIYNPPAATLVDGILTLAFGTGEREDLRFEGDSDPDTHEQNRFYVLKDPDPTGSAEVITESDISGSDVTNLDADPSLGDAGFFFSIPDGEKFVTDVTIFAGQVIVATFSQEQGDDECLTGGGQAFLYAFSVDSSLGFFGDPSDPDQAEGNEKRRFAIGGGLPSNPRVSLAPDPDDDRLYIKTSSGQIIMMDQFQRDDAANSFIYWRQIF